MRKGSNQFRAFTLVELLAVSVIVALLLFLLLPTLGRAKAKRQRIDCVDNLLRIGLAVREFALDHLDKWPFEVSTNKGGAAEFISDSGAAAQYFGCLSNELAKPKILVCPADTRKAAKTFLSLSNSKISYFVGPDIDETNPQALLAGDRTIGINASVSNTWLIVSSNVTVQWMNSHHGKGQGNAAFGDGSIQQLDTIGLNAQIRNYGLTNRLLIP